MLFNRNDSEKIKISKEKIVYLLWLCVIFLIILACTIAYWKNDHLIRISEDWTYEIPDGMRMWIDEVSFKDGYFTIEGYAFVHGEDLNIVQNQVVLYDETENLYYTINTSVCNKNDLTAYFNDGFSYDEGRFFARSSESNLKPGHDYLIYLLYRCNDHNVLINTERRLLDYVREG